MMRYVILYGFSSPVWNYETFLQRLQHIENAKLDDALEALPREYWQYYVMVYESRSSQEASLLYPRVIAFDGQARLIMAFNGHSDQTGYDTLEMIQFREETREFEFRQIQFPTPQNGLKRPLFSEENPKHCLGCHGVNPRPNWDDYPSWPGLYGSSDDELNETEFQGYQHFLQQSAGRERYRRLERLPGSSTSPFGRRGNGSMAFRPNLYFTKLLARRNAQRVAHRLLSLSAREDQLALAGLYLGCSDLFPKAVMPLARTLRMPAAEVTRHFKEGRVAQLTAALVERAKLLPRDFSLTFGGQNQLPYFDGLFHLDELISYQLLSWLDHPALKPVVKMKAYDYESPRSPELDRLRLKNVNALGGKLATDESEVCDAIVAALPGA